MYVPGYDPLPKLPPNRYFGLIPNIDLQARIGGDDPNSSRAIRLERYMSTDMKPTNRGVRDFLEHSRFAKSALKIIGVCGVALIMAGKYKTLY